VETRYLRVVQLDLPMPDDDASDDDWDAWADLQHVQALLSGWAGRVGSRRYGLRDDDSGYLSELHKLTSSPGLIHLVGDEVAADACVAADALFDLLSTG
jgi:hypothetical protein